MVVITNEIRIELVVSEDMPYQETMAFVLEQHAKYLREERNVPKYGKQNLEYGQQTISWYVAFKD